MPKVYALSTARAGSQTVPGKNLLTIKGKPLYLHNLLESMQTPEIIDTYLTTDIKYAIEHKDEYGYKVIEGFTAMHDGSMSHTEVIYHALLLMEEEIKDQIDILVVMLGNTINMDRHDVKKGLAILEEDPTVDSVITVIKANHFNPLRAYVDDGSGHITTFLDQELIKTKTSEKFLSDKNSMGDILFQNGLWMVRRQSLIDAKEKGVGLLPFPWFGNKIRYLVQEPHLQEIDDFYQVRLLE